MSELKNNKYFQLRRIMINNQNKIKIINRNNCNYN